MKKQLQLFADDSIDTENGYSAKIDSPVYEPKHTKPNLITLCDTTKTLLLIKAIDKSDLPDDEKEFLRIASWRHTVFHYERIADYYAHVLPDMQRLMEQSALVIIDFEAAIEHGFVKLCSRISKQFLEDYISNG